MLLMAALLLGINVAQAQMVATDVQPDAVTATMATLPREERAAYTKTVIEAVASQNLAPEEKTAALITIARALIASGRTTAVMAEVFASMPIEYLPAVARTLGQTNFAQALNQMNDADYDRLSQRLVKAISEHIIASSADAPAVRCGIAAATFVRASSNSDRTREPVIAALPPAIAAAAIVYMDAELAENDTALAAAAGVDNVEAAPEIDPDADNVVSTETASTGDGATTDATEGSADTAATEGAANEDSTEGTTEGAAAGTAVAASEAEAAGAPENAAEPTAADAMVAEATDGAAEPATEPTMADAATTEPAADATDVADVAEPVAEPASEPAADVASDAGAADPVAEPAAGSNVRVAAEDEDAPVQVPLLSRYSTDVLGHTLDTAFSTMYDWEASSPTSADPLGNPTIAFTRAEPVVGVDLEIPAGAGAVQPPGADVEIAPEPSDPYDRQRVGTRL